MNLPDNLDFSRLDKLYQELGDEKIKFLVSRFYHHMDSVPECKVIRIMHPPDLSSSEDKLYSFLIQRFGGPWLFNNKYGPPMMRARHLPFRIGTTERDLWLYCMDLALKDSLLESDLEDLLFVFFSDFAEKMRNQ